MEEIIEVTIYDSQGENKRPSYTDEKLQLCLKDIRSGNLTCNAASKLYCIPRTTLNSKLLGNRPDKKCRPGPEPTLGK